jgi:hypothetical protein
LARQGYERNHAASDRCSRYIEMTFQRAGLRPCRTAAKAADEGVLLSLALDLEKGISFLLVLGTATLKEKA